MLAPSTITTISHILAYYWLVLVLTMNVFMLMFEQTVEYLIVLNGIRVALLNQWRMVLIIFPQIGAFLVVSRKCSMFLQMLHNEAIPSVRLSDLPRIFNYQLSRAWIISKNLFGIIANSLRVFRSVIQKPPESIELLPLSTLTLHYFLRKSSSKNKYHPAGFMEDSSNQSPPTESMYPLGIFCCVKIFFKNLKCSCNNQCSRTVHIQFQW